MNLLNKPRNMVSILVMLSLFTSYPYIFECLLPIPSITVTGPLFFFLFCAILFYTSAKKIILPSFFTYVIVIQLICWFIYYIIHNDLSYITRMFFVGCSTIIIYTLYVRKELVQFVKIHNIVLAIQAVAGVLAFILILLGLLSNIQSIYDYR